MNKYVEYAISRCAYSCYKLFGSRENSEGKAILVTCFCPIGDTMMVIPFIRELRRNYPDYHILFFSGIYRIFNLELVEKEEMRCRT